jgi:hypothetical protein
MAGLKDPGDLYEVERRAYYAMSALFRRTGSG